MTLSLKIEDFGANSALSHWKSSRPPWLQTGPMAWLAHFAGFGVGAVSLAVSSASLGGEWLNEEHKANIESE
jgi:hypothetical protein